MEQFKQESGPKIEAVDLEKEELKRNLERLTDAWVRERAQRDYLEMVLRNIKHQLDKALQ